LRGLWVQGLGCRISKPQGFRVWGLGFGVEFGVKGGGFRIQDSGGLRDSGHWVVLRVGLRLLL
jgi:hypothetical protein